ncbi:MAG: hypothetical protein AAGD22_04915 [Verrucomicrobiota bacterium]
MATVEPEPNQDHPGIVRLVSIAAILLSLVVAFGAWQGRPLYHWLQDRRASEYMPRIDKALASQDYDEANVLLQSAYELSPNNPDVLRVAAKLALASKSQEVFSFLDRLEELQFSNLDDRILRCEAYLRLDYLERAKLAVEELSAQDPQNHAVLSLAVDVHLANHDHHSAKHALITLLKFHSHDLQRKLQLAKLLIEEGSSGDKKTGTEYLWELARGDSPVAILAIDHFCNDEELSKPLQKALVELIDQHPRSEERHRVHSMKVLSQLYPHQKSEIITEALQRSQNQSPHDAAVLFRWLSEEKEYKLILEQLPLTRARQSSLLMPIYLDALGQEDRWREAKSLLEDPSTPLSDPRRLTFAAFCANKLGEKPIEVDLILHRALRAAKQSSNHKEAFNAGMLAEELKLYETASLAYDLAKQDIRIADQAFHGLIRITDHSGDTLQIRDITKRFAQRFPRRNDLFERYLYLNLLSGIEIEATLDQALRLIDEEPSRTAPRIIAALGYLRLKDLESAKIVCAPCNVETLEPAQKVVYAAIAAQSGQPSLAQELLKNLDISTLLNEEKILLELADPPENNNPALSVSNRSTAL